MSVLETCRGVFAEAAVEFNDVRMLAIEGPAGVQDSESLLGWLEDTALDVRAITDFCGLIAAPPSRTCAVHLAVPPKSCDQDVSPDPRRIDLFKDAGGDVGEFLWRQDWKWSDRRPWATGEITDHVTITTSRET